MEDFQVQHEKSHILIVDDNFINRAVLKNIFSENYIIEEAENGLEALDKMKIFESKLAAIILDVNMPVMSGIELLKAIQPSEIAKGIPIFVVTSYEEGDIAKEAYELGVMDILNKPITPLVINRRVGTVIELFQARKILSERVASQEEKLIENTNTIDELNRTTIEALATAIEFRDVESGEHTNRIYGITKYILTHTEMGEGFSSDEIECMAIGSIMHDIGKIAISDAILNKPGKLTPEEFEIMKTHTVRGGELMEKLTRTQSHASYVYACDIARHHHERWDGKGYPDGLKGDEITVWSQVASIADVYDALVSPRVYKKAFEPDKALDMIMNGECGVFNPKLLKCFKEAEPVIRKWYTYGSKEYSEEEFFAEGAVRPENTIAEKINISQNFTETLLLMSAVKSTYDLIIFANLSKNTYYMFDDETYLNHTAKREGTFDTLIDFGVASVPKEDSAKFKEAFARENLIKAFSEGKRTVSIKHKQYSDDGTLCNMETTVMMIDDSRTGDIIDITLSRYI